MRNKSTEISMSITFRYADGSFKTVPYKFKSKEAYGTWLEKAEKDQGKRKIEKQHEIT